MTLTWANLLSTLRLALVPVFAVALVQGRTGVALALFVGAGLTDLLDGFVARSWRQQSRLGAYLDPAADKLLLVTAFAVLSWPVAGWPRLLPVWVFLLVIGRDLAIVIGALVIYLRIGFTAFAPSRLSKWNTAVQICGVFVVLLAVVVSARWPAWRGAADAVARGGTAAVVIFTVGSWLEFAYRFVYRYGDLAAGERS